MQVTLLPGERYIARDDLELAALADHAARGTVVVDRTQRLLADELERLDG